MRKLLLLLFVLAIPVASRQQGQGYVQVIGTKSCYANGSVNASFMNQSGSPQLPLLNGSVFPTTGTTNFDSAGKMSMYLADNNQVLPNPSQWSFVACAKPGGGPPCGTFQLTITGPGPVDVSTQLGPLQCGGSGGGGAAGQSGDVQLKNVDGSFGVSSPDRIWSDLKGTIYNYSNKAKYPDVDVTYPDFATGPTQACANAADPSGVLDSSCAIQNAIDFAWLRLGKNGVGTRIVFPMGFFTISKALRASTAFHLTGAGRGVTILNQMTPTAAGIVIYDDGRTGNPGNVGSISNMTVQYDNSLSGVLGQPFNGGVGTLVEDNFVVTNYVLHDMEIKNSGGRCLSYGVSSEELRLNNVWLTTCRTSLNGIGQASSQMNNVYAAGGGQTQNGYCFSINCVNGLQPSRLWNPTGETITALTIDPTGNNFTLTVTCTGCANQGINGTSAPIIAGHWFYLSGMTPAALNGIFQATAVSGTAGSTSFTITSNYDATNWPYGGIQTGGTPNVGPVGLPIMLGATLQSLTPGTTTPPTNAIFAPVKWPIKNSAIFMSSPAAKITNVRCDIANYSICFGLNGGQAFSIDTIYEEANPFGGAMPEMSSVDHVGMLMPWTATTQQISGAAPLAITVLDSSRFNNFATDPTQTQDLSSNAFNLVVVCPDYNPQQTGVACAANPAINTNQGEKMNVTFSPNGVMNIITRNVSGSTAPANSVWPAGSKVGYTAINANDFFGGGPQSVEIANVHGGNTVYYSGSSQYWYPYCNDDGPFVCAAHIVGVQYDRIMIWPPGYTTNIHVPRLVRYKNVGTAACGSTPEPIGAECIKAVNAFRVSVNDIDTVSFTTQHPMMPGAVSGQGFPLGYPGFVNVVYNGNGTPSISSGVFRDEQYNLTLICPTNTVGSCWAKQDYLIGGGNGSAFESTTGAALYGTQFTNDYPIYDTGGASTAVSITSWAFTPPSTLVLQGTNAFNGNNCLAISGLVTGSLFNTPTVNNQPVSCYPISGTTNSTQMTVSVAPLLVPNNYPTAATEGGTATQWMSNIRIRAIGGPANTGTAACFKVQFRNGASYADAFNVCANGSGGGTVTSASPIKTPSLTVNASTASTTANVLTAAWTPVAVNATTCTDQTFTVAGLVTTDYGVSIQPPSALGNLSATVNRVNAGSATIHFCNPTAASVTPPSGTWGIAVLH